MSGDFQVGEWSVQPAVNRLRRGDQVVRVEPKVMQVLVCLAESGGEVVTREQLIARVWPDVFVTDDVLHRAIRELRRVFGDTPAAPRYIETIRKRGYRLIPESTPAAAGLIADAEPHTTRGLSPDRRDSPRIKNSPSWRFSLFAATITLSVAGALAMLATRAHDPAPQAHARFVPIVSGPLNESDPAVSPDGRHIAFVQREVGDSGSADIYIRDLNTGAMTRVTDHPASDRMPAWSPDGTQLAFVRATSSACEIVIRRLSTGTDTRVAACGNDADAKLTWTADGTALLSSQTSARADADWRIVKIDLSSGVVTPVTLPPAGIVGDHSPAMSPDGRRFAFIRRSTGGVSDIYIASLDGQVERRVTFDEADLTGLDWTGDGRAIVYSSDRAGGYSLWRVNADGGMPQLLAGGAARMKHPVADRAARRVVYENWNYEINVWELASAEQGETGEHTRPVTQTSELWNLYPQVSPDGSRIAYVSTQSGSHQLWLADRDGANARQLTRVTGGGVKSPRWSPDARRIVFLARAGSGVDIHIVDPNTQATVQLTATAVNEVAPAWSHDSTRILYGAPAVDGGWDVWSVDANRGDDGRVEIENAVAAQTASSGDALYFTRPDEPGVWRQTHRATQASRIIEQVAAGDTLGWLVTPTAIYFVRERDAAVRLHRAALDGSGSAEIATLSQFTWPGFSVAANGAVLYARWDRRDSNLMSLEY